jgi:hypothetical protein
MAAAIDYYLEQSDFETAAAGLKDAHNSGLATAMTERYQQIIAGLDESSEQIGYMLSDYALAIGFSTNQTDIALDALDRAEGIAMAQDDEILLSSVMANRVNVYGGAVLPEQGIPYGKQALALTANAEASVSRYRAYQWTTTAHVQIGEIEEAAKLAGEAVKYATRWRDVRWQGHAHARVAEIHVNQGDWISARDAALMVLDTAQFGEGGSWMSAQVTLAYIAIQTGDEQSLHACLAELDEAANQRGLPSSGAPSSLRAIAAYSLVDFNGSADWIPHRHPERMLLLEIPGEFSRAFRAVIRHDRESATESLAVLESVIPPIVLFSFMHISVDRLRGLLHASLEDWDSAAQAFERALNVIRPAGMRPEVARTCSEYAEMLLDRDDASRTSANASASGGGDREKAIALQDEALAIARDLGMRPLTERILARREILRA